jgi:hypothetical protein
VRSWLASRLEYGCAAVAERRVASSAARGNACRAAGPRGRGRQHQAAVQSQPHLCRRVDADTQCTYTRNVPIERRLAIGSVPKCAEQRAGLTERTPCSTQHPRTLVQHIAGHTRHRHASVSRHARAAIGARAGRVAVGGGLGGRGRRRAAGALRGGPRAGGGRRARGAGRRGRAAAPRLRRDGAGGGVAARRYTHAPHRSTPAPASTLTLRAPRRLCIGV